MTQESKSTNDEMLNKFNDIYSAINQLFTYASDYNPETYLEELEELERTIHEEISIIENE